MKGPALTLNPLKAEVQICLCLSFIKKLRHEVPQAMGRASEVCEPLHLFSLEGPISAGKGS